MQTQDICAGNHGGDDNSVAANARTGKQRDRTLILTYLTMVADATCDEVELALGMNHQTCSARFSELKRDRLVEATVKRPTRTSCKAQAWKLAEPKD